jgi:hypothetical protein
MIVDLNEEEIVILLEITGTDLGTGMAETENRGEALATAKTKLKEALYTAYAANESDGTGFKS